MPSLKDKLVARQLTIGSWLSFGHTGVCEMMVRTGFEWLVVDLEHTGIGTHEMAHLIQVVALAGAVPLVRVGANDPLLIKRAMDCGAHGVIVPMVNTAEEAQRAVSAVRYPPHGTRGVGLYRAQGYGQDFEAYREWAAGESVLIVQIEHHVGAANLREILAVDGVDGFIVGPYDLSGSLGKPGQFDDPAVRATLDGIVAVMASSSKPGGFHVVKPDPEQVRLRIAEGFRFLAYGGDMLFLAETLRGERSFLDALRESRPLGGA
jgi:2-keto-3-deoxy-L-rhamnonate aldolase RhmA